MMSWDSYMDGTKAFSRDSEFASAVDSLYSGGWSYSDHDELMNRFGYSSHAADLICEALLMLESGCNDIRSE